jgi:uroporphyrinogen decarboxylase
MKKELVIEALRHKKLDVVPHHFGLTQSAREKVRAHYGDNYEEHLDNYLRIFFFDQPDRWEWIDKDVIQDLWGVQWDRSIDKDIGVPKNTVFPEPDMKYWNPPEIDGGLFTRLREQVCRKSDQFTLVALSFFVLYDRAWTLRGMENFLTDMIENPRFAGDLLEAITDWSVMATQAILEAPEVDAILFSDDWGQQNGLVLGSRLWRRYLEPRVKKLFDAVKKTGKFVAIHSCGKVQELFPLLIESGLDLFNPFQPEVMDVRTTYERYGKRLSFWGGLSVQRTLPLGTPDDVREEVRKLWDMGRGGGYILSPAHDVPSDVPAQNLVALIETVRELAV